MPTASQKTILIRTFKSNKTSVVGLIMAFCVVIIALFAPWISPYDPISQDMNVQHAPPNWSHPFGTDVMGGISSRESSGVRESLSRLPGLWAKGMERSWSFMSLPIFSGTSWWWEPSGWLPLSSSRQASVLPGKDNHVDIVDFPPPLPAYPAYRRQARRGIQPTFPWWALSFEKA